MIYVEIHSSVLPISFNMKPKITTKSLINKRSNLLTSLFSSEFVFFLEKRMNEIYNGIFKESLVIDVDTMIFIEKVKKLYY